MSRAFVYVYMFTKEVRKIDRWVLFREIPVCAVSKTIILAVDRRSRCYRGKLLTVLDTALEFNEAYH